jgi:hypothetical protein
MFYGPQQSRFDKEIVKALQPFGERAEYVECEKSGNNALDFRIAFFLGGLVHAVESAKVKPVVVVIAKDKDLDTLLEHMRSLGFDARRATTIREVLAPAIADKSVPVKVPKAAKWVPASNALQTLLAYLADHPKNRPTKLETLRNHLTNIFSGAITDQQKDDLVAELVSKGFAAVTGKKIEYKIPTRKKE